MNKNKKRIVEVAINFVLIILSNNPNAESLNEIHKIKQGNKEVILEHLKTIHNIVGDAIEIIGDKK